MDDIKLGGWRLDNEGYVEIPETPGLGIELDRAQLARFMPDVGRLLDPVIRLRNRPSEDHNSRTEARTVCQKGARRNTTIKNAKDKVPPIFEPRALSFAS